jgi:putative hydrolase of the HAD superfamily
MTNNIYSYSLFFFDLWNTLIKGNPEFSRARAKHIKTAFNLTEFSIEDIMIKFTETSRKFNKLNEMSGIHSDAKILYASALSDLGIELSYEEISNLESKINELFLMYPPKLYSEETLEILKQLKKKKKGLIIISNTGFIRGETLFKVINALFPKIFLCCIFSDEVGFAKPHGNIFYKAEKATSYIPSLYSVEKSKIIHVGDSSTADVEGAKRYGIDYFLINSNEKKIQDLITYKRGEKNK